MKHLNNYANNSNDMKLSAVINKIKQGKKAQNMHELSRAVAVFTENPSISNSIDGVMLTLKILSSSPISKIISTIHKPGVDEMVSLLESAEKYGRIRDDIKALDDLREDLINAKNDILKNYKYNKEFVMPGIVNFAAYIGTLGLNDEYKHLVLKEFSTNVAMLIYNIDIILWHKYNYENSINHMRNELKYLKRSDKRYDIIFSSKLANELDASKTLLYGSWKEGIKKLLALRNEWSNWIGNSKVSKGYFVTSHIDELKVKSPNYF